MKNDELAWGLKCAALWNLEILEDENLCQIWREEIKMARRGLGKFAAIFDELATLKKLSNFYLEAWRGMNLIGGLEEKRTGEFWAALHEAYCWCRKVKVLDKIK